MNPWLAFPLIFFGGIAYCFNGLLLADALDTPEGWNRVAIVVLWPVLLAIMSLLSVPMFIGIVLATIRGRTR